MIWVLQAPKSRTLIDSELELQSQLLNYSKASITIAYAVMVARVEGGGDGRPTPTIIEIDLVRKNFHDYNHPDDPREPFIAFLTCDHDVTQQPLFRSSYWPFKV